MSLLQNRAFAVCCAVLMAVCSVVGLGGFKLSAKRSVAVDAFYQGQNGFSAHEDLLERRESSYNLLRIAEEALPPSNQALTEAKAAWDAFDKAKTPQEYYEANLHLDAAVGALEKELTASGGLSARQEEIVRRQYTEFCGRQSNLRFDDYYNGIAASYNELCGRFPASFISAVTGNGKLPVFREGGN